MAVVFGPLTHQGPNRRSDCNSERNTNRHITKRCAENGTTGGPHSDDIVSRLIFAYYAVTLFDVRQYEV